MRVSVARRNLFSDLTRLAISVGGVAVAMLLIIVLLGVYRGSERQLTAYIDNVDADLWVAQAGSPDMLHSFSLLPAGLSSQIAATAGVAAVYPLTSRTTLVTIGEQKNSLIVIGYQPESGSGGPWQLAEGRGVEAPGELIADRVTMKMNNLRLGDSIAIDGAQHTIVGVSEGTTIIIAQYAFLPLSETQRTLGGDRINFFLVKVAEPAQLEEVRQAIATGRPEITVYTTEEFAANNSAVISQGLLPILAVIVVIAFIIGVAIVGLVVYSATLEKYREYGILKALGASGGRLYRIVLEQALLSSLIGYAVGAAASFGVARLVSRVIVQISIAFTWQQFFSAFIAALAMSVLASYIPLRKINSIDPLIVFKA